MAGTILTNIGLSKLAASTSQNQLNITHIAVGDGNGGFPTLSPAMTALTNEVWRGASSNPVKDDSNTNYVYFETNIPPEVGPFNVREIACFDSDGDMIAIGHTSLIAKPDPADDANFTVATKIFIALENTSDFDLIYQNSEVTSHISLSDRNVEGAHPASSISTNEGNLTESLKIRATDEALWGGRFVGYFEGGFSYKADSDVAKGPDGNYYSYIGSSNYPVNVAAGTVPSEESYKQVSIQDSVVNKSFEITTQDLITLNTINLSAGDVISTKGFYANGDGGGAEWVKTVNTGIPSQSPSDLGSAMLTDALGNQWALVVKSGINIKQLGSVADGETDNLTVYNAALSSSKVVITPLADKSHIVSGTLLLTEGQTLTGEDTVTREGSRCEIELAAGVDVPLVWVAGSRATVKNLKLTDNTDYDSIRDSWRVAIEVGTDVKWNVVHVEISGCYFTGFYDHIHIPYEADNLTIKNTYHARQTNANISFKRNREAYVIDGATIAPSSGVSISHFTAQEGSSKDWRPIKLDDNGVPSHDRYHFELYYIAESTISEVIANTAVNPIYQGVDTYVTYKAMLIEPIIHTKNVFEGSSLTVNAGDVVQFPNGESDNQPHLYKALSSGTLTTKTGWGTEVGESFEVDGVALLCGWRNIGVDSIDIYVKGTFENCRISREVCYDLGQRNAFDFVGCREFNDYSISFMLGDQTTVNITGCHFPNGKITNQGNRYLNVKGSNLGELDARRYSFDSNRVLQSSVSEGGITNFNFGHDANNYDEHIILDNWNTNADISISKAFIWTFADLASSGRTVRFIKRGGSGIISVRGYKLIRTGDSVSFTTKAGEGEPYPHSYTVRNEIGTTAERPQIGYENIVAHMYFDTDFQKPVFWDGNNQRWVFADGSLA